MWWTQKTNRTRDKEEESRGVIKQPDVGLVIAKQRFACLLLLLLLLLFGDRGKSVSRSWLCRALKRITKNKAKQEAKAREQRGLDFSIGELIKAGKS